MRKVLTILVLMLLGMNIITQPPGTMQSFSLHEMYGQCSKEDPDITPLDFVFEHLLNLEDVMHYFEGEENEMGEHPHEPFNLIQSTAYFAVAIPKQMQLELPFYKEFLEDKADYPLKKEDFYNCHFYADIFHPPLV